MSKRVPLQYAEERVQRDGLLALDRCAGGYVAEMLALLENCEDPEDGEMHLVRRWHLQSILTLLGLIPDSCTENLIEMA